MSTSNNMLKILGLFTLEQPILGADAICEQLEFSKPTGYRYIKDLVVHGLLERLYGGQYTLGPRVSVLDYIAKKSNPIIQISTPLMKSITEQTELNCSLTQFYENYCLDIHHESDPWGSLAAYGRGRPRPAYVGAAPKVIMANTALKFQNNFFDKNTEQIIATGFAETAEVFTQKLSLIKKQGYYLSKGEFEAPLTALAVPIVYSNKAFPLAIAVVGSVKRMNHIDVDSIVKMLHDTAKQIALEFKQAETP
ncbi:IclR family transcriptional regulator [Acinetobacter calcoaceticus]|uniref:HTH-type transcriptional repressor AllR n=1 Tax=Acinetobacter calcoaceticus TaxID=471 RepID=A0A4R1XWH8_ACICA|nr:IclR family transcriptional regulator [Acinetobacter calcoaceticus]